MNWWELPDGTLVRDVKGDLRMVHHGRDGARWLWHWSDEYSPWYDEKGLHVVDDEGASRQPVTVVKLADEVTDGG